MGKLFECESCGTEEEWEPGADTEWECCNSPNYFKVGV